MVRKSYYLLIGLFLSLNFAYSQKNDSINNYSIMIIEDPPIFEGSLTEFIQKNVNYPEKALHDSIEGTVIIEYWIDVDNSTTGHKVLRGIRKDIDEEALRVTKLIKYERPALQQGIPIKMRFTVPVNFKIRNEKK